MASMLKAGRQVALWSAGFGTAIPLILPTVLAEDKPTSGHCCQGKIKPSQLPIYDEPEDLYDITYHVSEKGKVQEGVEVVRQELEVALETTKELRDQIDHIYQTGRAHTAGQIAYLRDDENLPARAGAIAAGGLVGLLLGSRGRFVKKLLYSSVGAGATGAVLYPQYSKQYSQELWTSANTYATVAYNFLVGVKPQENDSGLAKEEIAATSPVDSGKSLDAKGMEVSNPYPSLLTLPYTTLFRKQESTLTLVSREKPTKVVQKVGLSDALLDRMADEASQVSILGFRLPVAENQMTEGPLSGFGSVSQEDTHKCKNCGKRKATKKKTSKDSEAKQQGWPSPSVEDSSKLNVPIEGVAMETSEKGIASKIESVSKEAVKVIDELKTGTEFVAEISDEVVIGAEAVEKVSKTVETVASLVPVVGIGVKVAIERVLDEAEIVAGVAGEVKQVAEKTEVVLDTVEKVAEDVETLAEKVSNLKEDSQTTKKTTVEPLEELVEQVEAAAGKATEVVDVIKAGTELVEEISEKVEAAAEKVVKFAEALENSEKLSPVISEAATIAAEKAGLVARIAGEVNKAAEKSGKVVDSVAEVVKKVETVAETISKIEKPASSADGNQANSHPPKTLFDKITSFFSSDEVTESIPLKSIPSKSVDSQQSEQLKTDQSGSEARSDEEVITSPQEPIDAPEPTKGLDSKLETPADIEVSEVPTIDQKEVSPQVQIDEDKQVIELYVATDAKPADLLAAEIVDTKAEAEEMKTPDSVTSSTEKPAVANDENIKSTLHTDQLTDQSVMKTKIDTQKDDTNDQQITLEKVEKLPEKKSLFSKFTELFSSKEPEAVQQNDALESRLPAASLEMTVNDDLKSKPEVSFPTRTQEVSAQADSVGSQAPVSPTLTSEPTEDPDAEARSATSLLLPETPGPHSETVPEPTTKAEPAALETVAQEQVVPAVLSHEVDLSQTIAHETTLLESAAQENTLPETVAQEDVLPETVTEEAVLSETVAEKAVLPETVAKKAVLPETVAEETVLPETVADEAVLPETVAEETVLLETVAEEAVLPETLALEAALPEALTPEPADPETLAPEVVQPEAVSRTPAVPETVAEQQSHPESATQQQTAPPAEAIKKSKSPDVKAFTTPEAAAAALPHKPAVTITQSEQDVIVSAEASNVVLSQEPRGAAKPVHVATVVRQVERYTIIEAPGTSGDVTLVDEPAAASASVSLKSGLDSHAGGDASKNNFPTSQANTQLAAGTAPLSAKTVSQSTLSDSKSREVSDTSKGAKNVVVRAVADKVEGGVPKPEEDHGQSNPEDADMYTTRS